MPATNLFKQLIAHRRRITKAVGGKRRRTKWKVPPVPLAPMQRYYSYLKGYFQNLKTSVNRHLVPRLPDLLDSFAKHHPELSRVKKKDDETDDLKRIIEQIYLEVTGAVDSDDIKGFTTIVGQDVSAINRVSLLQNIKDVANIDLLLEEPWLDSALGLFAVQNADLIQSVTDQLLDKVSARVYDAFRQGDRSESLSQDLKDILDITDSKAAFIARDQIGKLNGQLDRLRQTELGVDKYVWRGMDDDRERDTHRENNDEIFSWDDPPLETGHPGEDYNCRCYAEPVLDELIDQGTESEEDQVPENEA